MLEDRSLLYTGSGPEASRLAFDKWASKRCFIQAGVATPNAIRFDSSQEPAQLEKGVSEIGDRLVVKPLRQGSTIGVSIVDNGAPALDAARECAGQFGDCMIEQYIPGKEITVGVLQDRALPIIEIRAPSSSSIPSMTPHRSQKLKRRRWTASMHSAAGISQESISS
jgi:D-alanine-D-alanine ligase